MIEPLEDQYKYYDSYSAFLMRNAAVYGIFNGEDLIQRFEDGEGFEEFLAERKKDVSAER